MDQIIARADDDAFVSALLSDPRAAVAELGIALTDDEVTTLTSLSADEFRAFVQEYRTVTDPAKRRAAC